MEDPQPVLIIPGPPPVVNSYSSKAMTISDHCDNLFLCNDLRTISDALVGIRGIPEMSNEANQLEGKFSTRLLKDSLLKMLLT